MNDQPGTTIFEVAWHTPNLERSGRDSHLSTVAVIDGYSTMADIPKIIATKRTGDPSLAYLVIVDSTRAV